MASDRHGKHNKPTIAFRVTPYEQQVINERVKASGMKKQDYIVRSCIYNHVCVVGKRENLEILRSEAREMYTVLEEVSKDIKKDSPDLSEQGMGSMTASLGYQNPDELNVTLATILMKIVNEETFDDSLGILRHEEGIDLLPANIELAGMEVSLVNFMSRELVLRQYIDQVKNLYDYVLIDCMPSLGMLTINALACADAVLISVQAAYLPVKGLEDLIRTIGKVRRQLNRGLSIEGILITMVDRRTTYARDITELIHDTYGSQIRIFTHSIPFSVRAAEISAEGVSIFRHDPRGKVAEAYQYLTQEVLSDEE